MNEDLICALLIAALVILILYHFSPPENARMPRSRLVQNNMGIPTSFDQNPNSVMRKIGAEMRAKERAKYRAVHTRKRVVRSKKLRPAPNTVTRLGGRINYKVGNAGKQ